MEVIAQEDDEPPPSFEEVRESLPPQGFARVMPSARRALKARGLRPEEVTATGPGGRLLKEDVERYAGSRAELGEAPLPAPKAAAEPAAKSAPEPSVKPVAEPAFKPPPAAPDRARESARQEEIVPLSPLRRRVAERLVQAQHAAALLTTFNEVDMSAVLALRQQHQPKFQERYGIKLGLMSFFVKAAIEGLKLIPQLNGEIRGNDVVYRNYYDIGVAVGGGRGLVVPVIRSAERLSFAEVERAISDLAARAKNNQLKLDELQGGTFTISNGGVYGSLLSTPIVNPPQSGILGLHAILDRAVVVDKQIVVRPMMYVALTYDHRLVDGREAVTFLKRIKECVEDPARILIEV
jgi:2-oxoglutarate dehydrogenase E2 component (dihydrolipoamide succinyltransferase)